jgi:hypothetical protein
MRTTTARLPFISDTIFLQHTYGIQATIDHTHFKGVGKGIRKSIIRGNCKGMNEGILEDVTVSMTLGERGNDHYAA